MNVRVKTFDVGMELKNNGIEFEVRTPNNRHLGDLIITKSQLIWCEGRTQRANGKRMSLDEFRELMNERPARRR